MAVDIDALADELTNDPLTRGYAGMDDAAAAADLNTVYRTRNRTNMTGDELFAATDNTEFTGLTAHEQTLWVSFCGRDQIDPFGASNVAFVQHVFGGGSATIAALSSARTESVSRAVELFGQDVGEGDVWDARNG